MKKTPWTIEEHEAAGDLLHAMTGETTRLTCDICARYPVNSKAHRKACALDRAVRELRCELDRQLFIDDPINASTRTYYRANRDNPTTKTEDK